MKDENRKHEAGGNHFGSCPECGDSEGPFHVGRLHWFVCRKHGVRWWAGENLFRGWRFETEEEWRKTADWLKEFRIIEPSYLDVATGREASADER